MKARRIGRNGHDARIEAAEEGGDELQARRIEQESALSGLQRLAQSGGDGPGAAVQLRQREPGPFLLAVRQKNESLVLGPFGGTGADQGNQGSETGV